MKKIILFVIAFALMQTSFSQKRYFTKTGTIVFEAGTGLEDIDGINKSTTCVFDATTGQIEFALLVKGFEFKRSLMEEHFNENYLESDKYPKSIFKGKIVNIDKVNFQKNGIYPVVIKGSLEIHGVKKDVETKGVFNVKGETVAATSEFTIAMEDYKVEIPGLVKDKISKTAKLKVNCTYVVLK